MNARNISRIALGTMLIAAGIGHLTYARKEFQTQVPDWVPLDKDDTVVYSGIAEVVMGTALITAPQKYRKSVGQLVAGFFIAVFPGNISQYKNRRSGFGLDTDSRRLTRLLLQPLLIFWAAKSTRK